MFFFFFFFEKETENFILKFKGNFPMERKSAQGPQDESDGKPFLCQKLWFLKEKLAHVVIDTYFSLFLKCFEDFS